MKNTSSMACLVLLGLLAACGGGDDGIVEDVPAVILAVPASATESTQSFSRYASTLAADERAEPLDVAKVVPPTSETEEPIALN